MSTAIGSVIRAPFDRRMVLRRLPVIWGVTDAGLSSLATFAAGIFASRYLAPATLGGYALVFSASVLSAIVPTQLIFVPGETAAIALPGSVRLLAMRRTLFLGGVTTLVAALAVLLAATIIPDSIPARSVEALILTGCINSFVSPIQDHVRRMLHLANRSGTVAFMSGIHAVAVVVSIIAAMRTGVAPEWVPFGALAIGNAGSLCYGVAAARSSARGDAPALPLADLLAGGRWLLLVGLLAPGTAFVVATVIARVTGPETLGYAEACRQVAQPLLVFATGLSTVIGPRLTSAAFERATAGARHQTRSFVLLMSLVGVPYVVLAGWASTWNPLAAILPNAYAVPGLVLATLAANFCNGLNFAQRAELLGAREARTLARVEVIGNLARIGVAGLATVLRAFAIPVGLVVLGIIRMIAYSFRLRRHYGPAPSAWSRGTGATTWRSVAVAPQKGGQPKNTTLPALSQDSVRQ